MRKGMPIHSGPGSTLLSWNGTCPESPDGRRLTYFLMERPASEEGETLNGEVWICDRDFGNHRKIMNAVMTCSGFQHNGAMASWIDDRRLAFRETEGGRETIHIVDVDSGEPTLPPIIGSIGHYAVDHHLAFGVPPGYEDKNPDCPGIDEPGIYMLNCDTGDVTKILATADILAFLQSKGLTPKEETPRMSHVMPNQSRTRVMARWDAVECQVIISANLSGEEKTLFRDKPLHQLWHDDDTYYPVDRHNTGNICRWAQDGTLLETLAGKGNHIDMSPDKEWFVTDSMYRTSPVFVDLFRRGETTVQSRLNEHTIMHPVWKLMAHPNPVFSRDGTRVYFVQAISEDRVNAVCVDISAMLQ